MEPPPAGYKLDGSLGGHDARDAFIHPHGLRQGASDGFELSLNDVVLVCAVQNFDVQIAAAVFGKRVPEMLDQLHGKRADGLARIDCAMNEIRPARQIYDRARQRFIHGHIGGAITHNAAFVPKRLRKSLPQGNRDVFDRVMIINVQVALAFDCQVKQPVAREQVKHVVEKADAGVNCARACSIEIQRDGNVCFFSFAFDFCLSGHDGTILAKEGQFVFVREQNQQKNEQVC